MTGGGERHGGQGQERPSYWGLYLHCYRKEVSIG